MGINAKRYRSQLIIQWIFIVIVMIVFIFDFLRKCPNEISKEKEVKYYSDCPSIGCEENLFGIYSEIINDSKWLMKSSQSSPRFDEVHQLIYGLSNETIYSNWKNLYQMKIDLSYPYTSLNQYLFKQILKKIQIPIKLIVEVGSFEGKSAINMMNTLLKRDELVMLCIDTWIGSIEHWNNNEQRKLMKIVNGRPIIYEQFLANIIFNNLTNKVIPLSTTSLIGGRFLLENKYLAQIVYLDSSHVERETFFELELFWLIVEKGGIIFGDDWSWKSVRCDVTRFVQSIQAKLIVISNTWIIIKH